MSVDGLIVPGEIPGDDLDPVQVQEAAGVLGGTAAAVVLHTTTIEAAWAGLPAVYQAPTGPDVYTAVAPAVEATRSYANKLDGVRKALNTYADHLPAIKTAFNGIRADAVAFLKDFDAEDRVWVAASATTTYQWDSNLVQGTVSKVEISRVQTPVEYLRGKGETARIHDGVAQVRAYWQESSWHVDRNNQLLDRVADTVGKLQQAQAECVNTINRLRDHKTTPMKPVQSWQLKQEGENLAELPWGHRVEETRTCGEGFYHGVGTGIGDIAGGIGGLLTYNPAKGGEGWLDWDHFTASWNGVGQVIHDVLTVSLPITALISLIPGVQSDAYQKAGERLSGNAEDALKGLTGWDEWAKNPGEGAGRAAVGLGSIIIPTPKGISAIIKTLEEGGTAAKALETVVPKLDGIGRTAGAAEALAKVPGVSVAGR